MTSRMILVSGKGGVGKTTVAAATALASARRGRKTLVMSFDMAHSLADSFDLSAELFSRDLGRPVTVEPNLDVLEIDLQTELRRQWGDTYKFLSGMLYGSANLQGALADEVGIMPGMEDMIALGCLRAHEREGRYDLIVLDLPPTAEALGFVGFGSILEWYVRKRLPFDRRVCRLVRPIAVRLDREMEMFMPEDSHFDVIQRVAGELSELDAVLRDPTRTSIRLVTNPEKMVVLETKRAFMYFSLYGINIDAVVVNRLFPRDSQYFAARVSLQDSFVNEIRNDFYPVRVFTAPLLPSEVLGVDGLTRFASEVYADAAPDDIFSCERGYEVTKEADGGYRLEVPLPFVEKDQIQLTRSGQDLGIRVGTFKRTAVLPRHVAALETRGARVEGGRLVIQFSGRG